jgi:hypothetical protein
MVIRVKPHPAQQLHGIGCGDPFLIVELSSPSSRWILTGEKISPPTLAGAAHPFLDNSCFALSKQIAHDLPTDGRVAIQQPLNYLFLGHTSPTSVFAVNHYHIQFTGKQYVKSITINHEYL